MANHQITKEEAKQNLTSMFAKYMPWIKPEDIPQKIDIRSEQSYQTVSMLIKICFERINAQVKDEAAAKQTISLLNAFSEGFEMLSKRGSPVTDPESLKRYNDGIDIYSRGAWAQQFQTADELYADFATIKQSAAILGISYKDPAATPHSSLRL